MTKTIYSIILFAALLFVSNVHAQQKSAPTNDTKQLPDCVVIKDGKLKAKAGYTVTVSKDGKQFTVSNAKGVGGTFICSCSILSDGNCSAKVNGGTIICDGGCGCTVSVVISGVQFAVDISAGLLRKI
ncbi:MAG: hypothetical protein KAY50_05490 [Chitinophagaceae bacterium]|nr:hypothetical protein [Chitinophagaceae bacterium]HQW45160.1 hypothetical protein [Chitinophagaceae bacterium]